MCPHTADDGAAESKNKINKKQAEGLLDEAENVRKTSVAESQAACAAEKQVFTTIFTTTIVPTIF